MQPKLVPGNSAGNVTAYYGNCCVLGNLSGDLTSVIPMCSAKAKTTESNNSTSGLIQLQIFTPTPFFGTLSALSSLWMVLQLGSSRTWSQMVFHSQKTSP